MNGKRDDEKFSGKRRRRFASRRKSWDVLCCRGCGISLASGRWCERCQTYSRVVSWVDEIERGNSRRYPPRRRR